MNLSESVLGASTVRALRASGTASVLTIGSDTLTRADLAAVGCYNFVAAKNLSTILNRELQVKNLRDVFERVAPQELALPRLGSISLAVLGAAFEALGIGGDTPLESYVRKHLDGARMTTFTHMKHREQEEAARERKEKKKRKGERRDQAHHLRVERLTERVS